MELDKLMNVTPVESQRPGQHRPQKVRELFKGKAVAWFSARSQWFLLQPRRKSGQYTVSLNLMADPLSTLLVMDPPPTATQAESKGPQAEQK